MKWNKETNNFIILNDKNTGYNRLNRKTFNLNEQIKTFIKKGHYSDYHCYRPYKDYKDINDKIVDLLN